MIKSVRYPGLLRGTDPGSSRSGRGRFTVELFRVLTMLGLGLVATETAWAQDTPAKKAEELRGVPAEGQGPAPAEAPVDALSVRYRFTEKYAITEDLEQPELISEYKVASRATFKIVAEKPQGAPAQSQTSSQMIYTERPAKVTKLGEVTDAVRRYDAFRIKAMTPPRPPKPPWYQGLTIWYHRRPGQEPEIESLTDGRPLRELEFDQITKQLFLPQLAAVFPPTPVRVGDTWHVPLNAARYLVGETPDPEGYTLEGTLIEVRKGAPGTAQTAVIGIAGQFTMSDPALFGQKGEWGVNTRIFFNFEPRAAVAPAVGTATSPGSTGGGAKGAEKIVNARGWVSQVRTANKTAYYTPGNDSRLAKTVTSELHLERRRQPSTPNGAVDAKDAPLSIPEIPPGANEDNSWLVYEDPQFQFRHPQDLRPEPREMGPNIVGLVDRQFRGSYVINIQLWPKTANPDRDRQIRDPDFHRNELYSSLEKREIVKGPTGWLPEADWAPLKRKVYRIEAATQPPGAAANAPRLYCDYYLVLFTAINQTVVVKAFTNEDHLKFRDQTESAIKSFQFGPSEGQPKDPAATQTPAPTPPL